MDICWKFLRNHLQNLSAVGVYYASVNFIQYNLHFFFKWPHRIPCDFSHVQFHSREKGGEGERERKRDSLPSLPPLLLSLRFLNQKKRKEKRKKTGETEQMLKNRFLKITVNQS